jgi:hypothetical protein
MAVRSIAPRLFWVPRGRSFAWQALLQAVMYPRSEGRDLRLDLLRGFFVFAMIVDHIGGSSWLYAITGGNRWLVSAAEGFVFVSGLTMGMVYRVKLQRLGLRAASWAALQRARTLYLLTVALTLGFTLIARLTDLAIWTERYLAAGEPLELLVGALTLHYTYHGADILAIYTILVACTPLLLFLLAEGKTSWIIAGSWLLWAGYQHFPEQFAVPWAIRNNHYFPLAAWQVLFVGGLVIGWHRQALSAVVRERLGVLRAAPVRVSLFSPVAALLSVGWIDHGHFADWALDPMVGPFAKPSLGPGRLLLFLALFALAYLVLTVAWGPIARATGSLLLPLGQTALYGYTMQLLLILPIYNTLDLSREAPEQIAVNSAVQLAAVATVWLMVKTRFLFGVIPR